MLQAKANNTASTIASTPAPSTMHTINNKSNINITDDEFNFCTKKNDNEIILVTGNNVTVNKGKYKGETGTIIKITKKKIALNLGKITSLLE